MPDVERSEIMQIDHQPANLTVNVNSNLTLRHLQDELKKSRQFLPVGPFDNDVTVQEIVNYNLLGPHAIEHGILRNWVLGLTANVNGEDVEFGSQVMKNVAGYDTAKLFIGAQGKLGEVKQVIFKVLPNQFQVNHIPSTILDGSRVVLELSQVDNFILDIKKGDKTYYHYEGLGVIDVNIDISFFNNNNQIIGAKYIQLVNGVPIPKKSEHVDIIDKIEQIFHSDETNH